MFAWKDCSYKIITGNKALYDLFKDLTLTLFFDLCDKADKGDNKIHEALKIIF